MTDAAITGKYDERRGDELGAPTGLVMAGGVRAVMGSECCDRCGDGR